MNLNYPLDVDEHGNTYIEGIVPVKVRAYVTHETSEEEAKVLLEEQRERLAGSNDGSEALANTPVLFGHPNFCPCCGTQIDTILG